MVTDHGCKQSYRSRVSSGDYRMLGSQRKPYVMGSRTGPGGGGWFGNMQVMESSRQLPT